MCSSPVDLSLTLAEIDVFNLMNPNETKGKIHTVQTVCWKRLSGKKFQISITLISQNVREIL